MADITISITAEGADALDQTKKSLLQAVESNLNERDRLQKTLDGVGADLGYLQSKVEEVIQMTTTAMNRSNDAVTTLSGKLGKMAAWIRTKL